ncbi:unnamed protein product [Miscanthus lutarioriparius]|uniref:25S rRNA (uridine-N(3))-methyltransferase BMT5-like domain-containing protein n=1 Tax=Miscanthus lutarioriparius TaxID=422564 RepID=A0A811N452_9POAL|nr:unnamed protein product [Miscanthus lutarioriparius]
MAVATEAAAGGNGEGIPLPAGVAATAANGSQQGYPAEGVLVVGSMAPRAEGVLVIDLTAVTEEEEQKKDHSTAYARRESQIDLTAQTEEEGEDEKEAQGVDGPRAEGVPVMIDLTEESSDDDDDDEERRRSHTLKKKYSGAESNLTELKKMGAVTLHGVNAKTMKLHTDLKMRRFDRVIFNFPHAGFKGKKTNHI